jgi:hypothetical protein
MVVVYGAIPSLRKLRQEDQEFEASLNYLTRPCLKKKKKKIVKVQKAQQVQRNITG